MTDKLPRVTLVSARVDIDLRLAQIRRDRVTGEQERTGGVLADVDGEEVEEWLISKSPSVLCVCDVGDVFPL